jgi:hypothetical protein
VKRIAAIFLLLLAGCLPDKPAPPPTRSADRLALEIIAMYLNEAQTNWTVVVTARTNAP